MTQVLFHLISRSLLRLKFPYHWITWVFEQLQFICPFSVWAWGQSSPSLEGRQRTRTRPECRSNTPENEAMIVCVWGSFVVKIQSWINQTLMAKIKWENCMVIGRHSYLNQFFMDATWLLIVLSWGEKKFFRKLDDHHQRSSVSLPSLTAS